MSANRNGIPFYLNRAGHEILGVAQDRDISGMKTLYLRSEWAQRDSREGKITGGHPKWLVGG